MNILAYKTGDNAVYNSSVPLCPDGTSSGYLRAIRHGGIIWDRTLPFSDPNNLLEGLEAMVEPEAPEGGTAAEPVQVNELDIWCHGLPGHLAMVQGSGNRLDLSVHGPTLRDISGLLHRPSRRRDDLPVVMFVSCAAAAPPEGTALFRDLSTWMRNTRVIGFETLLTTDGMNERAGLVEEECRRPDIRVSDAHAEPAGTLLAPGGHWTSSAVRSFPSVGQRVAHAREFVNGRLVWESRESAAASGGSRRHLALGYRPPLQSAQGRRAAAHRTRII